MLLEKFKPEKPASPKEFGIVFAAFFCLVAFLPIIKGHQPRLWALGPALVFFLLAFQAPRLLMPFAQAWQIVGELMHKITNPIVLGLMYFTCFTPFAIYFRLRGKVLLELKWKNDLASYWIIRDSSNTSLKNQF